MSEQTKYTPGPLTVVVRETWPYPIQTTDAGGNVVFSRDMPCFGSGQETLAHCLAGHNMRVWQETAIAQNARAIADEVLRAAAPDLLGELQQILAWATIEKAPLREQEIDSIRALISKATTQPTS